MSVHVVPKITNTNEENFKVAEEFWIKTIQEHKDDDMQKAMNIIFNDRRDYRYVKKGGIYSNDNHFRLTYNLCDAEENALMTMNDSQIMNYCITVAKVAPGLNALRTIESINFNYISGAYHIERFPMGERGRENLSILLYLCGIGTISKKDVENQINKFARRNICLTNEKGL